MKVQHAIERKLQRELHPVHLQVINESGNHNVPPGSETHFKVVAASPSFEGRTAVARHRLVHGILSAELNAGVHALSLQLFSPAQWRESGGAFAASPPCANKK